MTSLIHEYRPCVVAAFTNETGEVLVCERSDAPGSWQLPQGGIDPGESALNALYREMREEIGCDDFKVVKEGAGQVRYRFPQQLAKPISKKWIGQAQTWFHCRLAATAKIDIEASEGEFTDFKWVSVAEAIKNIIDWKQEAYREGFKKIGLLPHD
jgi:putative (di)nucleoside polyphosphate hydrolase